MCSLRGNSEDTAESWATELVDLPHAMNTTTDERARIKGSVFRSAPVRQPHRPPQLTPSDVRPAAERVCIGCWRVLYCNKICQTYIYSKLTADIRLEGIGRPDTAWFAGPLRGPIYRSWRGLGSEDWMGITHGPRNTTSCTLASHLQFSDFLDTSQYALVSPPKLYQQISEPRGIILQAKARQL